MGRRPAAAMTMAALALLLAPRAQAQHPAAARTDATVLRPASFRVGITSSWTRYHELYGVLRSGERAALGSLFSTDSLGPAQLTRLGEVEEAVRNLSGVSTMRVTAGRLRTEADARIVTVPIAIEYGVTHRLTVGVLIPVVQSRATVVTTVNAARADTARNLGLNPAAFFDQPGARAQNDAVAASLIGAYATLAARDDVCAQSPTAPGCADYLPRRNEAIALLNRAAAFARDAIRLYGATSPDAEGLFPTSVGQPLVPLAGSAVQVAIDDRLAAIRTEFSGFGIDGGAGVFTAAVAPVGTDQLPRLLRDPVFGIAKDSIGVTERIELGDIEVGATYQLHNSFADSATDAPGVRQSRAVIQGILRLGTGRPARPNRLYDIGTGDGQMDVELRSAMDVLWSRRWAGSAVAAVNLQFGDTPPVTAGGLPALPLGALQETPSLDICPTLPDTPGCSVSYGHSASLRLVPRFFLSPLVMLSASYSLRHERYRGAPLASGATSATEHRIGAGVAYSSFRQRLPGAPDVPVELWYRHERTILASGGIVPHATLDLIGATAYFGWRR